MFLFELAYTRSDYSHKRFVYEIAEFFFIFKPLNYFIHFYKMTAPKKIFSLLHILTGL